jgi:lipoprotein Spr
MSFKQTWVRKVVSVSLCAVIGFTGLALGQAPAASAAVKITKADKVITLGKRYLGVRYRFGAPSGSTKSFDCSSFMQYIFGKNGVRLPRVSSAQATKGYRVSKSKLKKGDLVFFNRPGYRIGHVAVYAGSNKILHTYGAGGVRMTSLSGYWTSHYVTARRVL